MNQAQKRTFIRKGVEIELIQSKKGDILEVYEPDGEFIGNWNIESDPEINENGITQVIAKVTNT